VGGGLCPDGIHAKVCGKAEHHGATFARVGLRACRLAGNYDHEQHGMRRQPNFEFTLNGERVRVAGVAADDDVARLAAEWRADGEQAGLRRGRLRGLLGGARGARCQGQATYRAINSCIALLPMFAGREVVTVEGLTCPKGRGGVTGKAGVTASCIRCRAMVEHFGSQCGYCTPGFVMSMFEGYYRDGVKTAADINDQLAGNLCRCTGYRPIRDAMAAAVAGREVETRATDEAMRFARGWRSRCPRRAG
jgi:xanthine dehydrogenase iron-sulfur cluster and FAD-binding subunit A